VRSIAYWSFAAVFVSLAPPISAQFGPTTVRVDASKVINRVSPWMYGSCIEDVNHEIYGGLYAQRIFGESFEEPPTGAPIAGWTAFGGEWSVSDGSLRVPPSAGAKMVRQGVEIGDGSVECEVRLADAQGGNAGLILRVGDPRLGAEEAMHEDCVKVLAGDELLVPMLWYRRSPSRVRCAGARGCHAKTRQG